MDLEFKEGSKKSFIAHDNQSNLNMDQINTGCMQRIADATELMAKSNASLVWERDYFKRRAMDAEASLSTMTRSRNALKGVVKRMKKAANLSKGGDDNG